MKEQLTSIISFYIKNEIFAFDTLKVRNILEYCVPTRVPNAKDYVLGVINLHGNIFPVADLRIMMGVENIENSIDTSIIVVSSDGKSNSLIGLVVDSVKEVFDLDQTHNIQDSVLNGNTGLVNSFIGSIQLDDEYFHLIDLDETVQVIEN